MLPKWLRNRPEIKKLFETLEFVEHPPETLRSRYTEQADAA